VQELARQPPSLRGSAACVRSRFGRGSSGAGSPKEQPAYQRVSSQHGEARQESVGRANIRNDSINSERDPQRSHSSVYPSTLRHRDGVGSRAGATRITRKASSSNVRSTLVAIGRHPRCTLGRLAVMPPKRTTPPRRDSHLLLR
jgi:hypothetical protein